MANVSVISKTMALTGLKMDIVPLPVIQGPNPAWPDH